MERTSKTGLKPGPKPGSKRVKEKDKKKCFGASLTQSDANKAKRMYGNIGNAVRIAIKYNKLIESAQKKAFEDAINALE